jgi:hypothetical protein
LTTIKFTDRYEGIGRPHPWRYCRGACEATGVVPVQIPEVDRGPDATLAVEDNAELLARARAQHAEMGDHECDGWHFVTCPDCNGTRLASWPTSIRAIPGLIRRDLRFFWQHGVIQFSRPQHWSRRRQLATILRVIARRDA